MKTAKKIVKSILALLPMFGMIILFATSFNAKTETYPYQSSISFTYSESDGVGWFEFGVPEAPNAKIIGSLYGTYYNLNENAPQYAGNLTRNTLFLARLSNTIGEVTGIPLTYIAIPVWYTFYLFVIEIAFMIANILTFIPRKCSEIFGG